VAPYRCVRRESRSNSAAHRTGLVLWGLAASEERLGRLNTSAIEIVGLKSRGGVPKPTTGVTRCRHGYVLGSCPSLHPSAARPISSGSPHRGLRSAGIPGSARRGKLIWPAVVRCAAAGKQDRELLLALTREPDAAGRISRSLRQRDRRRAPAHDSMPGKRGRSQVSSSTKSGIYVIDHAGLLFYGGGVAARRRPEFCLGVPARLSTASG